MFRKKRIATALAVVLLLIVGGFFFAPAILPPIGNFFVVDEPPTRSDALLVLAGDRTGSRILHGAKLVQQGYAPRVLVSGPYNIYGRNEADLAIAFAVSQGCPESIFEAGRLPARSTEEEARQWHTELTRRGARKLLLVTSNYHTARARRIFRKVMPEIEIHTVGSDDPDYQPASWWKTREGMKIVFLESFKELSRLVGL